VKNVKLFLYLSLLTVSLLSAAEQAPEHTLATLAARLQALELENKSLRESQLTASSIGAFVGTRMNDYARKTD